ncbi:MAG: hypothetical protein ACYDDA_12430 [Acidiferrobacteraceae bacterium]
MDRKSFDRPQDETPVIDPTQVVAHQALVPVEIDETPIATPMTREEVLVRMLQAEHPSEEEDAQRARAQYASGGASAAILDALRLHVAALRVARVDRFRAKIEQTHRGIIKQPGRADLHRRLYRLANAYHMHQTLALKTSATLKKQHPKSALAAEALLRHSTQKTVTALNMAPLSYGPMREKIHAIARKIHQSINALVQRISGAAARAGQGRGAAHAAPRL